MCHLPLHHPSLQNLDRDFLGRIIQADWVGRSMTDSHYICVRLLTLLVCILWGLCLMCEIDAAHTIDAAHRNTHLTHQLFWRNSAFTLILVFSYLKRVTYLHWTCAVCSLLIKALFMQIHVGIDNGNLRWYKNKIWDQIFVNWWQKKGSKTNTTYYIYDLQLLCWSYSICLFRYTCNFSLKLSPYLKLQLFTFFQWKAWSLTHACITADNIVSAFKEIWAQVGWL